MEAKDIVNAWARIRKNDNTIPDEVLDFMKDAAIEKLLNMQLSAFRCTNSNNLDIVVDNFKP